MVRRRRRRMMRWYTKLASWIFPERASTQTWLILTFALFIGLAVAAIGIYVTVSVRNDVATATEDLLYRQAERAAAEAEQASTEAELLTSMRAISHLADLHVTMLNADSVLWDVRSGSTILRDLETATMQVSPDDPVRFYEVKPRGAERRLYIEMYRPRLGAAIRVGQPQPMLLTLVERMQVALVAGMIMALLLALLGSWVAASQITTPLLAIRNSARNIASGKFSEKIRVDSRAREMHDLADSLNRMADSYREKIDELERLAQIQNEFIGNVSHEVKNPIFAVSGYLEALASDNLSPEIRKRYAEKGLNNLERLNSLFSDLIEIARLEYREDMLRTSVFDLQELITEVAEVLMPKAESKDIELVFTNRQFFVEADRNRIRQVLINLIDNAIAYSDAGAVRCRIRRHLDKVRIEVVDNGRGIDEEHLDRVFERFYRVDPDRSRKSGGTGLGLSIVRQIIQAHGEQIHAESTLGRGSRFWFELPYAEEPVEAIS